MSIMVAHDAQGKAMPHRRFGRRRLAGGEFIGPNPDTAAVWEYTGTDSNGNGRVDFEEQMHRSCGHVAIKDNLLYIADFSGIVHCVDATTGRPHWTHDLFAATWASSPLIVDSKVFVADEDGDIAILRHSARYEPLAEINMGNAVYASPVVANNVLYIANKTHLFAIQVDGEK